MEARITSANNYQSPAEIAFERQLRSVLPVNLNNLKIKVTDDDEFKERKRKDEEKEANQVLCLAHKIKERVKIGGSSKNINR